MRRTKVGVPRPLLLVGICRCFTMSSGRLEKKNYKTTTTKNSGTVTRSQPTAEVKSRSSDVTMTMSLPTDHLRAVTFCEPEFVDSVKEIAVCPSNSVDFFLISR